MIVYNVTIKTDWAIHAEWMQWMLKEHIPEILSTGLFYQYRMMRLLEADETEGPTYAIQYHAQSKSDYERYIRDFSIALQTKAYEKWGDKFIAFRTVMEQVNKE